MRRNETKDTNKNNYINTLRKELLYLIEHELSPIAFKYCYSDIALESNVKWKPVVLILGNYSSGKSTLINDFIGVKVQTTGQAPTDDGFTVITSLEDEDESLSKIERITAEPSIHPFEEDETLKETNIRQREGQVLLNDPIYPFEKLKRHGERFAAHFKLKRVASAKLRDLVIIDTPGMLDSVSERERGFDYQEVIGDLAQIADLVLVLFDPHKAGTVREAHASLRDTLPRRTFEDRLIFVLNRVDECLALEDLIRVYGTLCWNLSQMTGRKDIPRILLTYSAKAAASKKDHPFLHLLANQREELHTAIGNAPKHRIDHLASFVESHTTRLSHLLEAIINYNKGRSVYVLKYSLGGISVSLLIAAIFGFYLDQVEPFGPLDGQVVMSISAAAAFFCAGLWQIFVQKVLIQIYHHKCMHNLEELTPILSQSRKESWQAIVDPLRTYLNLSKRRASNSTVKREHDTLLRIIAKGAPNIRQAINDISDT